jgi:hypothetical protein
MNRQSLARLARPSSSVAPYLLLLALWIAIAWLQVGYDSPDEHFPTLEAAGGLLFGQWNATWEWTSGLRSWLQPLILAALLKPWVWAGVQDRLVLDSIARTFVALSWLPGIWGAGELTRRLNPLATRADPRLPSRVQHWVACSAPLAIWGTRHGSDPFAAPALVAGFALLLGSSARPARALAAGALLGLAFSLRFTLGVPIAIGCLAWAWQDRSWRLLPRTLATLAGVHGLCALVDAFMYRSWAGRAVWPAWEFFRFNILEGSGGFHASPWWELGLYALLLWIPAAGWLVPAARARRPERPWAWITVLGTLVAFSLIRHKELRFVLPLLPLMAVASVPGAPRWILLAGKAIGAALWIVVLTFYTDPHGNLVRGLETARKELAREPDRELVLVDIEGGLPDFYLGPHGNPRRVSPEDWLASCGAGLERPSIVISALNCPDAAPGARCARIRALVESWGHRFRQNISTTQTVRAVYRCDPSGWRHGRPTSHR